ncbi:MAG: CBS domain-containing protein [Deltaproteobacteria bacterium]|nr:CBS domain-containing protein [Deltaproteobacteria bacterium]
MSSALFAPAPLESHRDLYGPFAAAVEALRHVPCDALARPSRRIETADPDDLLLVAASRMGWRKVGALGVVREGRLVGVLSEDDLLRVTAQRLGELATHVADVGDALVLWQDLLGGLRVGDVMTPLDALAIAKPGLDMVTGLARICAATRFGTRFRYLWILDDAGAVERVVSVRDMARSLTRIYDGDFPDDALRDPGRAAELRFLVAALLDLTIGTIRERLALGHGPSVIRVDASGEETVARMWVDRRGYVLTTLRDGAAQGICTRRDLVRGLRDPFADLGDLRVANLMTGQVKTVSDTNTLCGLFKLMAIEGCRHMPLVDASDRVVRMISMWEALSLFAPRREAAI